MVFKKKGKIKLGILLPLLTFDLRMYKRKIMCGFKHVNLTPYLNNKKCMKNSNLHNRKPNRDSCLSYHPFHTDLYAERNMPMCAHT
jgi:hypothetical protein